MKKILTIFAILIVAFGLIYLLLPNQKPKEFTVYIADKTLNYGQTITKQDIKKLVISYKAPWMVTDPKKVLGKYVNSTISIGRFLDVSQVSTKKDMIFTNGEGEYTIKTDSPSALNGGLISKGDHIEVIMTKRDSKSTIATYQQSTYVIAKNLVVVSIRNRDGGSIGQNNKGIASSSNSPYAVTLKANEQQAEELAWGEENGTLSLFKVPSKG